MNKDGSSDKCHRAKCLLFSGHLLAVHEISQVCHITKYYSNKRQEASFIG